MISPEIVESFFVLRLFHVTMSDKVHRIQTVDMIVSKMFLLFLVQLFEDCQRFLQKSLEYYIQLFKEYSKIT